MEYPSVDDNLSWGVVQYESKQSSWLFIHDGNTVALSAYAFQLFNIACTMCTTEAI